MFNFGCHQSLSKIWWMYQNNWSQLRPFLLNLYVLSYICRIFIIPVYFSRTIAQILWALCPLSISTLRCVLVPVKARRWSITTHLLWPCTSALLPSFVLVLPSHLYWSTSICTGVSLAFTPQPLPWTRRSCSVLIPDRGRSIFTGWGGPICTNFDS